ncbi:hypothetical protein ACRAWG_00335 [Methylobacterium sp. P31]
MKVKPGDQFTLQGADAAAPTWTEKYPEATRPVVARFGRPDHGNPILKAFNETVADTAVGGEGKSVVVAESQLAQLKADWPPVFRQLKPEFNPQEERKQCYLLFEVPWLDHPFYEDHRLFGTGDLYEEVAARVGIAINEEMFASLRDEGRGPYPVGSSYASVITVARYMSWVFNIPPEGASLPEALRKPAGESQDPTGSKLWVLAADEGGETAQMEHLLTTLGAEVLRAGSELEAAQVVSQRRVDGVVWRFNGKVDAELIVATICRQNGIPFVMITNGATRPAALALGGVVLHNPRSLFDVLAALESLPSRKTSGLNFATLYDD